MGISLGALDKYIAPFTMVTMVPGRASKTAAHTLTSAPTNPCITMVNHGINAQERPDRPLQAQPFGVSAGGIGQKRGGIAMLSDLQIKKAANRDKAYKLADDRGLYVYVSATGAKSFRLKYRYGGKEKALTIGRWPEVTLSRARELAIIARTDLAEGRDPGISKQQRRAASAASSASTLEAIAREYHRKQSGRYAPRQYQTFIASLENDIFPALGALPITDITVPMLLGQLERIESRGAIETAHRVRRRLDVIWAYAIGTGRAALNPATQLRGTLTPVNRLAKQPAVLTLADAREVYRAVSNTPADAVVVGASRLLALTATRPGDVRGMAWDELSGLDTDAPVWRIPAARLKGTIEQKADASRAHVVPLSAAAAAAIAFVRPLTGHLRLVFASHRFPNQPMSDMTLSMLFKRAGFDGRHVPHGWRATFSTIMNELHPEESAAIDATLAHVKGGVEGRYNRAVHIARRRELLAEWANMLTGDDLTSATPLPAPAA